MNTSNLFMTGFYIAMDEELCKIEGAEWAKKFSNSEAMQSAISFISQRIRQAYSFVQNTGICKWKIPIVEHNFVKMHRTYTKFAEKIGVSPFYCPFKLGMQFSIEACLLESIEKEFGWALKKNPLLLFMFDIEKNYAAGMKNGWSHVLMLLKQWKESKKDSSALTVDDIINLHAACTRQVACTTDGKLIKKGLGSEAVCYTLRRALTDTGAKEWAAFYDKINEKGLKDGIKIWKYSITETKEKKIRSFSMERDTWDENDPHNVEKNKKFSYILSSVVDSLIKDYKKAIYLASFIRDKAQRETAQRLAVITLCQSLERAHPFEDANGRVFEFLLPNLLLLSLGLSAYAPIEPYHFDGASRQELLQELLAGQHRVTALQTL